MEKARISPGVHEVVRISTRKNGGEEEQEVDNGERK